MDKDAYIKALEKQTTDMGAARFILALAKQNPGLSQLFLTTLGQFHRNASTTTSSKQVPDPVEAYRKYYCRDKRQFAAWAKRQPQTGGNDNPQAGGN